VAKSKLKYEGSALPGNAETVTLWEQTNGQHGDMESYCATFFFDQNANNTLIGQYTDAADDVPTASATWRQFHTQTMATGATAIRVEIRITEFRRWRMRWTNGATPQTVFVVDQALSELRT
jgi:hypothetical protein